MATKKRLNGYGSSLTGPLGSWWKGSSLERDTRYLLGEKKARKPEIAPPATASVCGPSTVSVAKKLAPGKQKLLKK
ncbi:hypothetical protein [Candidatus Methylacidithermus pantelleriae]|uniref:hypothetical protein n=1 Tax=Candidatus Methylacidithermus pantelleriae TaxID=2744239 RepID=UPI00157DBB30|nr:hypothetical protein [Candidatus Methylacidithermus pantelleriae]